MTKENFREKIIQIAWENLQEANESIDALFTELRNDVLEEAAKRVDEHNDYCYDSDVYANWVRNLKSDTTKGETHAW